MPMNHDFIREMSRRTFLGRGAAGLGMVALNSLLTPRRCAAGHRGRLPVRSGPWGHRRMPRSGCGGWR